MVTVKTLDEYLSDCQFLALKGILELFGDNRIVMFVQTELAEDFHVSASVISQAVKTMKMLGIVETIISKQGTAMRVIDEDMFVRLRNEFSQVEI